MASKPIKVLLQYCVPQHALSRLAGFLANNQNRWLKNYLINWFIGRYQVNMQEAVEENPAVYPTFNHFFTRALKPSLRPLASEENAISSPVDGIISQYGEIKGSNIFQAKGLDYTLSGLLAKPAEQVKAFNSGLFATFYLAPRDYHRVHLPINGKLCAMQYVPGQLFSVNPTTVINIDNLFARNERVICWFDTVVGPVVVVLVGAMLVASVATTWHGQVTVPKARNKQVSDWDYQQANIQLARGDELGHFQLGSTVILLFPANSLEWETKLTVGRAVKMGEKIAQLNK